MAPDDRSRSRYSRASPAEWLRACFSHSMARSTSPGSTLKLFAAAGIFSSLLATASEAFGRCRCGGGMALSDSADGVSRGLYFFRPEFHDPLDLLVHAR